jgi:HK97 family phage prohead protease
VRIELLPAPIEVQAAAPPGDAGDAPRRRIAGLAVPYGVEARVGFQLVTFAPGSVTVADRVPLLLGHDPNRPVGVLAEHSDTADGLRAAYAIDQTSDGDAALTQAASGSRAGLSVGVDLERFDQDPDNPDRITVLAARLAETSLVALAAYPAAGVDQVAASEPPPAPPRTEEPMPDEPLTPPAENVAASSVAAAGDAPAPLAGAGGAGAAPAPPARPALILAERDAPRMRLGEYVQTFIRAERGDRASRERIEAALTRETIESNPGVIPIQYVSEIIDSLGADRPLFQAMAHAPMPDAGMTIRTPEITARPDGGFLADDTAGAPTNAVTIGNHDVAVRQWAWGGSASVALVERSDPGYVETVYSQVIKSYYRDVEAEIAAAFPDAIGGAASLGTAVAQYQEAYRSFPSILVLGGLAYGRLLDATGFLMFASGEADAKGGATVAGLRVVTSPDLPPGDGWVTEPDFLQVRESTPIRLSVSDVESLSLEIGVTSFYAQDQARQTIGGVAGAVGIPVFTPPAGDPAAASRRGGGERAK